jgi:hypothetical protein
MIPFHMRRLGSKVMAPFLYINPENNDISSAWKDQGIVTESGPAFFYSPE